jgi:uncharacterized integral membrane protein
LFRFVSKLVYWIFALALMAMAVVVAVSNRDIVALSFDPLPFNLSAPLYAVIFSSISIGLVAGAIAGVWSSGRRWRRKRKKDMETTSNSTALTDD